MENGSLVFTSMCPLQKCSHLDFPAMLVLDKIAILKAYFYFKGIFPTDIFRLLGVQGTQVHRSPLHSSKTSALLPSALSSAGK